MSAIDLHARPSKDFEAKLAETKRAAEMRVRRVLSQVDELVRVVGEVVELVGVGTTRHELVRPATDHERR